jgi:hypothetical protein
MPSLAAAISIHPSSFLVINDCARTNLGFPPSFSIRVELGSYHDGTWHRYHDDWDGSTQHGVINRRSWVHITPALNPPAAKLSQHPCIMMPIATLAGV